MTHPNMRMRPRPREQRTQPGRNRDLCPADRDLFLQLLQELHDEPQTGRHAHHQEDQ